MTVDKAQSNSTNVEQFAKGVDEVFIKLVYLSPFALVLLLVFEELRDVGYAIIFAGILLAALWALLE